jgi:hypothetical protein
MEWIFNNIFIHFVFVIIYFFYWYDGWKADKRLFKKLKELEKVNGITDHIYYMKEKLPWGGFSRNFDSLVDKDDTNEVIIVKEQYILSIKKFQKVSWMFLLYWILNFIYAFFQHNVLL